MANILVVDDDPDIVELVSLKLRSSGHSVTAVGSGEAALDGAYAGEEGSRDEVEDAGGDRQQQNQTEEESFHGCPKASGKKGPALNASRAGPLSQALRRV